MKLLCISVTTETNKCQFLSSSVSMWQNQTSNRNDVMINQETVGWSVKVIQRQKMKYSVIPHDVWQTLILSPIQP